MEDAHAYAPKRLPMPKRLRAGRHSGMQARINTENWTHP